MTGIMREFARDERGAAIIEMGLALPLLSLMLIGMVDISRAVAAKLNLEQAAQSTIETVQQQGYAHSTASLAALKTEAEARAGTGSVATATAYLECRDGATRTTAALSTTCSGGATAARYVSVSITLTHAPLFGFKLIGANANGTYNLSGEAALRFQ